MATTSPLLACPLMPCTSTFLPLLLPWPSLWPFTLLTSADDAATSLRLLEARGRQTLRPLLLLLMLLPLLLLLLLLLVLYCLNLNYDLPVLVVARLALIHTVAHVGPPQAQAVILADVLR